MYLIQQTQPSQVNSIAICHQLCFPSSFAAKLGMSYSKKTLEWFLAGENRFLFHIADDDKIIGYCGGFQSLGKGDGSTSGMIQYAMREAVMGMLRKPWLLLHKDIIGFYPLIIKNIYRKIFSVSQNKTSPVIIPGSVQIGLVVIGVHPEYRGRGYFDRLMQHFEEMCRQRHATKMILSVRKENTRAIAAYTKCGWNKGSETEHALEMYKLLPASIKQ